MSRWFFKYSSAHWVARYTGLRYVRFLGSRTTGINMSVDTSGGHPAMDYHEHTRTYSGFLRGTVILSTLVALILISMLVFLV